jgi:hypothetical protein
MQHAAGFPGFSRLRAHSCSSRRTKPGVDGGSGRPFGTSGPLHCVAPGSNRGSSLDGERAPDTGTGSPWNRYRLSSGPRPTTPFWRGNRQAGLRPKTCRGPAISERSRAQNHPGQADQPRTPPNHPDAAFASARPENQAGAGRSSPPATISPVSMPVFSRPRFGVWTFRRSLLRLDPRRGRHFACPFSAPRHAGPDGPPPADNVEVTRCRTCQPQQCSMRCVPEIGPGWSTGPFREDSWRVNGSTWPGTARIGFISFAPASSK